MILPRRTLLRSAAGAALGLALALWMISLKIWWFERTPPGLVFHGHLQGDQKIYVALVRAAAETPSGLAYAYPWDLSPDPPRIFFQLPISILAWIGRLAPDLEYHQVFDRFRLIFATAMFAALAALVSACVPWRRWFAPALVLTALGGGAAWIAACAGSSGVGGGVGSGAEPSFLLRTAMIEARYEWWFLNVARNVFFPIETFHHFLFFAMTLALIRGRTSIAVAFLLAGLASNPFPAIQMGALLVPVLAADAAGIGIRGGERKRGFRRRTLTPLAIALAGIGALGAYYTLFLPRWEIGRALVKQHAEAAADPLHPADMLLGYGPLIVTLAAALLAGPNPRSRLARRTDRILLIWLLGGLALASNSRIPGVSLQPMHFTRGYIYLPLALLAIRALRGGPPRPGVRHAFRVSSALLWALALLLLPDTILFAARRYALPLPANNISYTRAQEEVIRLTDGHAGRIYIGDPSLSKIATAETGCRTLTADPFITPDYDARLQALGDMVRTGRHEEFHARYGVTLFVFPVRIWRGIEPYADRAFNARAFREVLNNGEYMALERIASATNANPEAADGD